MISNKMSQKRISDHLKHKKAEMLQRELVLPLFIMITLMILIMMFLSIPLHKSSLKEIKEFIKEAYEIRMDEYFGPRKPKYV